MSKVIWMASTMIQDIFFIFAELKVGVRVDRTLFHLEPERKGNFVIFSEGLSVNWHYLHVIIYVRTFEVDQMRNIV